MIKDKMELRIVDEAHQTQEQTRAARVNAILEKDFDDFKRMRAFVRKHAAKLLGKEMTIQISSVQICDSHECLILNDLVLTSYSEAEPIIRKALEQK